MKAGDKPEISSKWWKQNRPDDIDGKLLEKALVRAEDALSAAKKTKDADSINKARAALGGLGTAVGRTIKDECDQNNHKDVIAVLERYDAVIYDKLNELHLAPGSGTSREERKFEDVRPKAYFTPEAFKKHFHIAGNAECKKRAHEIFMWRFFRKKPGQGNEKKHEEEQPRVKISTLICLSEREFVSFAREVFDRQQEFDKGQSPYISKKKYNLLSRGGDRPADNKRVTCTQAAFKFGVTKNPNDPNALWVVNHVENA
jgi:hypothetical protein